ncbi:BANP isoform 13 [Pan troglodytes]|uniref:BTG3 associated nuclear protein n=3 Tax=Hominidae TaxID=9604 RepID=E9PIP2_HUMAN|nr:BTG3 associated nuclear protein isoform 8 [Homo sapiens]PNI45900.1 BANP isoform 9 [Pan troglodytes]PNI45903.1 BANP isoform 13 [Pan troglodytes]PNJ12581.1 BANP isoform 14 [Pongo abelii]PNJ12584.1 BANP isoform 17 [Pongo abelii]
MMSEHDLADVVQIAVEDLSPDHPGTELWDSSCFGESCSDR